VNIPKLALGISIFTSLTFMAFSFVVYDSRLVTQDLAKKLSDEKIRFENLRWLYNGHVETSHVQFMELQKKISLLEESIDPKNFRWAKIKRIRDAVDKENHKFATIIDMNKFAAAVYDRSQEYDVSISLILGVIKTESNFSPKVISHAGAKGLMQLMPGTAKECASDTGRRYYNIFKIKDNVRFGTWYLWKMMNRFNGNLDLAIRAYNCGPTCVERVEGGEWSDYPSETKEYLELVLKHKERYESLGL